MTSLLFVAALAGAQVTPAADPWQPWLGCWVAEDDRAGTGARTCVSPAAEGGVSVVTTLGVQELSRETRRADGLDHPVVADDCRGNERHRWSANGRRLYRTATVACNSEPSRTLASVAFMRNGPIWVDVQTVQQGADTSVRVVRYRPAPDPRVPRSAVRPAYDLGEVRWSVDDVLELSAILPPDGVQAAIGEGPSAFALNKRTLVALADAGVAERVIDLMVGLTYPSHFVIEPGGPGGFGGGAFGGGVLDPFFAPILGPASIYGCYSPYAWATPGYFSYCGAMSPYLLGYGPGYYYGYYNSSWFATNAAIQGTGSSGSASGGDGRVVNGRGYTQVTPVDTAAGVGGTWGGQDVNGGTSSGGSSGVSSGGYSGGGGGAGAGDGGRMAMPRPPGL